MVSKGTQKIITIISFLSLLLFVSSCNTTPSHDELLQLNLNDHDKMAMHIHPFVEIEILGEQQVIPDAIGITQTGMRVIHTHGTDGKLHVESPYPAEFYLQDFFTIWGKTFNRSQIFFYTADDTHTLKVYLNGKEDNRFGEIPLQDGDRIKIVYG